jgi:hypothetical protein
VWACRYPAIVAPGRKQKTPKSALAIQRQASISDDFVADIRLWDNAAINKSNPYPGYPDPVDTDNRKPSGSPPS